MLDLASAYSHISDFVQSKGYSDRVYVTTNGDAEVRIGDVGTKGADFHIELRREDGAEFRYSLSIYLREFDRVLRSKYSGNGDFAEGKWLQYTHIVWGSGSDAVRISFVRTEGDAGVWRDCIYDLLDACIDEYARLDDGQRLIQGNFLESLNSINRQQTFFILRLSSSC